MNTQQANGISLVQILENLGCKPARKTAKEYIYLSPIRNEKTPSFHVNLGKNLWYDHGIGEGGGVNKFAIMRLKFMNEACTPYDAQRWLNNMSGLKPFIVPVSEEHSLIEDKKLILKDAYKIKHPALIHYLQYRGIPLSLAHNYLKEIRIHNKATDKVFFALGWPNEEEGYEFTNKLMKGCVGAKSISFIRGTKPKPEGINVFEGFMDFLSALPCSEHKKPEDDSLILNSVALLKQATSYIQGYGYKVVYTWLDNDPAGDRATNNIAEFCKTEDGLIHRQMNDIYKPFKDVNEWHINKLKLGE